MIRIHFQLEGVNSQLDLAREIESLIDSKKMGVGTTVEVLTPKDYDQLDVEVLNGEFVYQGRACR